MDSGGAVLKSYLTKGTLLNFGGPCLSCLLAPFRTMYTRIQKKDN